MVYMVSKDENKIVIWPIYFDGSLSRKKGRRVKREYLRDKKPPSVEDIARIAKSLGLHTMIEKDAMHPSCAWRKDGRVLVDKKNPKQRVLSEIAKRL